MLFIHGRPLRSWRARQRKTSITRATVTIALAIMLALSSCVSAESRKGGDEAKYPQRPITVIAGFPAGSATDVLARKIAKEIEDGTDWTVVVENQPGASGSVALGSLKARAGDGYTFLFGGGSLSFTAAKDFSSGELQGVSVAAKQATALAVNADSPYRDLRDLISAAQGDGSTITLGLPGALNYNTADLYKFSEAAKLNIRWVPFEGGAPLATALLGSQIDAGAASPVNFVPGVKGEKLRMLAVTGDEKVPGAPDVKTFREQGYDIPASQYYAFAGRGDVPPEIVDKFAGAVDDALKSPSMRDYYRQQGLLPVDMDVAAAHKFLRDESKSAQDVAPSLKALFK